MSTILEGRKLRKEYGGLVAVDDVDLDLEEGLIMGLIGPNGAGKTTLINLLTGIEEPTAGTVTFDGEDITDLDPGEICRRGLVKTNQTVRPLGDLTVRENVAVAGVFGGGLDSMAESKERAGELLEFVGIGEFAEWPASKLTHTTARKLEVARALATDPEVILLDESAAGLSSAELEEFIDVIEDIRSEREVTILWIEHVMEAIMGVADRVMVIHFGEKIAEGTPDEIIEDETVQEAYLGEAATNA